MSAGRSRDAGGGGTDVPARSSVNARGGGKELSISLLSPRLPRCVLCLPHPVSLPMDSTRVEVEEASPPLLSLPLFPLLLWLSLSLSFPLSLSHTHTFPWVKGNNGAGRTGQPCAELQTLDKWVGRRHVTICRQVISFANGFSKEKEKMCVCGERGQPDKVMDRGGGGNKASH